MELLLWLLFLLFCFVLHISACASLLYHTYSLCWCVCIIISVDYGNLAVDFLYNLNIAQLAHAVYDALFCAFSVQNIYYTRVSRLYSVFICIVFVMTITFTTCIVGSNCIHVYDLDMRAAITMYLNCEAVLRRSADDWGAGQCRLLCNDFHVHCAGSYMWMYMSMYMSRARQRN